MKEISNDAYARAVFNTIKITWPVLHMAWNTTLYKKQRIILAADQKACIDIKSFSHIAYDEIKSLNLPVDFRDLKN